MPNPEDILRHLNAAVEAVDESVSQLAEASLGVERAAHTFGSVTEGSRDAEVSEATSYYNEAGRIQSDLSKTVLALRRELGRLVVLAHPEQMKSADVRWALGATGSAFQSYIPHLHRLKADKVRDNLYSRDYLAGVVSQPGFTVNPEERKTDEPTKHALYHTLVEFSDKPEAQAIMDRTEQKFDEAIREELEKSRFPGYLQPEQIARIAGVSSRTVNNWVANNGLQADAGPPAGSRSGEVYPRVLVPEQALRNFLRWIRPGQE